ncbi:MAG TPA: DUF418 domain-containing protein [Candidatus Krumholzibacterium sp.]|nr:DUF418 domain-containing protein [Candidatus Krumholzibacterium sp.]
MEETGQTAAGIESRVAEATPVSRENRIASVDVLRGLALLGILVINVQSFALPDMAIKMPSIAGGMEGMDRIAWWVSYLFFYHKCMPVFSMLFGAGLVLMNDRASGKSFPFRRFWMRRSFWLIAIGALHGYLLWGGDILYTYGVCGLLIYLFRNRSVRSLVVIASVLYVIGVPAVMAAGYYFDDVRSGSAAYEEKIEAGEEPDGAQARQHDVWMELKKDLEPSPEQLEEIYSVHRGGYIGILRSRAPDVLMMHTAMFLFVVMWRIGGLMLYGMALMKGRVMSAEKSYRFYIIQCVAGYGAGFLLVVTGARLMIDGGYDVVEIYRRSGLFNTFGGPLVSMGHIGLAMIMCKAGVLGWLRNSLSAVGRMALTNYLSHTVICTTLFYGYGFGLYGRLGRAELYWVVLAVWAVQMTVSPVWLRFFRFGPVEWVWRSLTYGRRQPFRA